MFENIITLTVKQFKFLWYDWRKKTKKQTNWRRFIYTLMNTEETPNVRYNHSNSFVGSKCEHVQTPWIHKESA